MCKTVRERERVRVIKKEGNGEGRVLDREVRIGEEREGEDKGNQKTFVVFNFRTFICVFFSFSSFL